MATRMQQRRGTAQQWTDANPVLAAGEIGFETDTNQFKIGDGVNLWSALSYFKNLEDLGGSLDDYILVTARAAANGVAPLDADGEIPLGFMAKLIDGADSNLNTLRELGDLVTLHETHIQSTTDVHGINNTADLATKNYADAAVGTHNSDTTGVHGIVNTANLALLSDVSDSVSLHNSDTTDVHGIADTAALATKTYADGAVTTHNSDTTDIHGISNTANLVYSSDLSGHADDTTSIHGISNTADLAYLSNIADHNSDTTDVHGIADTAALATKTYADSAVTTAVSALTKSSVGLGNVDNTADADKPVSTATQTALDLKSDIAGPTFTGTVTVPTLAVTTTATGITKSMVGLGNVDNTSDANKPVSTATQTALDAKASLSGATFTGSVEIDQNLTVDGNLTVNGTTFNASATSITIEDNMVQLAHQNSANTVDLGIVVAYNDGAAKHAGIVRDVSDAKWKLFKDVSTEPSTTVAFGEGSLDALAVGALEATTVTPSSGVVFSDGTQTKEGVASRTPIIAKTDSYTLSALTERDSLIEVAKSTATTITIPTDATLNFPIGTSIDILQTSTGQVTIAGAAGVTVNATPGLKLRTTWSSATLFKRAANTWVVYGDLTA